MNFIDWRGGPWPTLMPPRSCRIRHQSTHDNSPLPARYQIKNDNSPVLQDSLPDFERGFRPACEVKTGTFDPRTTFCRPGGLPLSVNIVRRYRLSPSCRTVVNCFFCIAPKLSFFIYVETKNRKTNIFVLRIIVYHFPSLSFYK